jgi:hypothetical protein
MKEIRYLSPTAIFLWERDRQMFYLKYLSEIETPRDPQTKAMAIGAAFDAYVKVFLTNALFGDGFKWDAIFEAQVEPQNRDWAKEHGKIVFEKYKDSGALGDLLLELQGSDEKPRFELTIENRVPHEGVIGGIPFLGKPDAYYKSRDGKMVVHDWKVNGYLSYASPKAGYVELYDNGRKAGFHKSVMPSMIGDLYVNKGQDLGDWGVQMMIYAWILGERIDSGWIGCVHQIVKAKRMRVAVHRTLISREMQKETMGKCAQIWTRIQNKEIFDENNSVYLDTDPKLLALCR